MIVRNEEADLVGIGVEPSFAVGQRALLVRTPHGNVLWDCIYNFRLTLGSGVITAMLAMNCTSMTSRSFRH